MTRDSGSILSAVSGDHVGVDHSAVQSIDAERVEMRGAAARDVRSETMDLQDSAVLTLRANDVQMRDCAAGVVAVAGDASGAVEELLAFGDQFGRG